MRKEGFMHGAKIISVALSAAMFFSAVPAASAEKNDPESLNISSACAAGKTFHQCFPDNALAKTVANAVGKQSDDTMSSQDFEITTLNGDYSNITQLTGISSLAHLQTLSLRNNNISDLSPLVGLPELTRLRLYKNNIVDVSPLGTLKQLKFLGLGDNRISDISSLTELTELEEINLSHNQITTFSALTGNSKLKLLSLSGNKIQEISELTRFHNLVGVDLTENPVMDVSGITTDPSNYPSSYLVITDVYVNQEVSINRGDTLSVAAPKGYDGKPVRPYTITNGGYFDAQTGNVVWNNVQASGDYSFWFDVQGAGKSNDNPYSGGIARAVAVRGVQSSSAVSDAPAMSDEPIVAQSASLVYSGKDAETNGYAIPIDADSNSQGRGGRLQLLQQTRHVLLILALLRSAFRIRN